MEQHQNIDLIEKGDLEEARWRTRSGRRRSNTSPWIYVVVSVTALWTLFAYGPSFSGGAVPFARLPLRLDSTPGKVDGVNATLGFERIFAINLEHRRDKYDELTLLAYTSGLQIDVEKAVTTKGLEHMVTTERAKTATAPEFAAIRSHINVLTKIVQEGISSALIWEDDIDWEKDIKQTLALMQGPLSRLISGIRQDDVSRAPTQKTPYAANDWDMLVLAACNEGHWDANVVRESKDPVIQRALAHDPNFLPFVTYKDPTVADSTKLRNEVKAAMQNSNVSIPTAETPLWMRDRMIVRARIPTCATGYAVTKRGAAKLLYHLTRPTFDPMDWEIAHMAQSGALEAYTVIPSPMDQWILTGDGAFNSDIHATDAFQAQKARMDLGWTPNLQQSARQLIRKIVEPEL